MSMSDLWLTVRDETAYRFERLAPTRVTPVRLSQPVWAWYFALLCVLDAGDTWTTMEGLRQHRGQEANPLARWMFDHFTMLGGNIILMVGFVLTLLLALRVATRTRFAMLRVSAAGIVVLVVAAKAVVVFSNYCIMTTGDTPLHFWPFTG